MSETSRRRGMHPILAFVLGFLLAFIIMAGAVAGGVIYALNYKLDKISANKSVDDDGNTTYLFINADPSNGGIGTVKDLISKLSEMSKGYKNLTVGEVEKLIPIMGSLTSKLETELNNYVNLEEGELQDVKLGELSEYMSNLVDRINVAKLIGIAPENAILLYMGYGVHSAYLEDGVWHAIYKDEEGVEHPVTLELNDAGQVIEASYTDGDGETHTAGYLTLDNAAERVNGVCEDLTIGEIIGDVDEDNIILSSIKNSTVNTIADDINKLCIQQILANEVYAPSNDSEDYKAQIYKAVDGTPTAATTYKDEYTVYYEFKDGKYVLAGNNGKLTSEEYGDGTGLFTLGEGEIMFDASYLYYTRDEDTGDYTMYNAGQSEAGRLSDLNGGEYYTYGCAAPLWKLLLYVKVDDDHKEEQVFTFNNIGELIANVSKNTEHTPLRELHAAGILTFDDPSELDTVKIKQTEDGRQNVPIGDIPLGKLIGYAVAAFQMLP